MTQQEICITVHARFEPLRSRATQPVFLGQSNTVAGHPRLTSRTGNAGLSLSRFILESPERNSHYQTERECTLLRPPGEGRHSSKPEWTLIGPQP
ncbi:UNVERIFIED_CONTAM: hypothetical protein HHA_453850 [Hammondia hammondi]|eukprot:XP_008887162.1 hypothetical protein HHA_453850 [Hammondia hammondi]